MVGYLVVITVLAYWGAANLFCGLLFYMKIINFQVTKKQRMPNMLADSCVEGACQVDISLYYIHTHTHSAFQINHLPLEWVDFELELII